MSVVVFALVVVLALGVVCGFAAVIGGRVGGSGRARFGPRTPRRRWAWAGVAFVLVGGAVAGLVAAPEEGEPAPSPLAEAEVVAIFDPRCEVLMRPFAVVPDGDVGPELQRPFWAGYAVALRTLAAELDLVEVDAGAQPGVDGLIGALTARAVSVDRELVVWSEGVPDDMTLADAASAEGRLRDAELLAAFADLGLEGETWSCVAGVTPDPVAEMQRLAALAGRR